MRWIKADKTLPDEANPYLVVVSLYGGRIPEERWIRVYQFSKQFGWRGEFDYVQGRVTHWSSLPELPTK